MAELFVNDVTTTLASSTTTSATSLTIASAAGLPTMAAGDVMRARLEPATPTGAFELVWVTARSGTTLTVTRGAEGTTATAWASGDRVSFVVSAATFAPTVINAKDYGILDATGATDAGPIMVACYNAALAALAGGAKSTEIVWPAGTFLMSSGAPSTATALYFRSSTNGHTGLVKLRGQGAGATTFKMTTGCYNLVGNASDPTGVLGNLALEGFTVDHNNINVAGRPVALLSIFTGDQDIDRISVQNVNVINMHGPNFNTVVLGISIQEYVSTWNSATRSNITNISVRHCDFKGGMYGVQIQAYNAAIYTSAMRDSATLTGGFDSNTFIDNIILEDFKWDSQAVNFSDAAANVSDSAGVMIGQGGILGRIRLTDCVVKGSYDVGYELGSGFDTILTRCYAEDSVNESFYHRHQGGMADMDGPAGAGPAFSRFNFTMVDCTARVNKLASLTLGRTHSSGLSVPGGFVMDAFDFGLPSGNVTIRNFQYIADGPGAIYAWGQVNAIHGGFRNVDLENIRVSFINVAPNETYGIFTGALIVEQTPGRGTFRLRGLHYNLEGTSSMNSSLLTVVPLWLASFTDSTIDIDGVYSRVKLTGSQPAYVEIFFGANNANQDNFGSVTALQEGWRSDLNASGQAFTDFTVTGGTTLNVASPGSKEYRLTQIRNETGGKLLAPTTDQNTWLQCVKPTTPTSAYKQGVRLKVAPLTGTESVHCYVDYTGTNYRIRIDTESGGTLTNRAATTIGTTVTAPFYVRGKIIDNVVTAEYLTAAPTSTTTPAATSTATYTLNNTDGTLALFGAQAPQGYPGLVWKPVDSGSTATSLYSYVMSVVSGRIARVAPLGIVGTVAAYQLTPYSSPASAQFRFRRTLELEQWDLSGYATVGLAGAPVGFVSPDDDALISKMRASRWNWLTPPAAAAITVGASPYTYTNLDYYDKDVSVYAGTVSNISVTRVGGSASQVSDSTGRIIRLTPGESVTVTYSVAPTMRQTPVT